jgi:hypothetical protein
MADDPRTEAAAKAIGCYSDEQWDRWRHTSKGQQALGRAVAGLAAADLVDPLRVLLADKARATAFIEHAAWATMYDPHGWAGAIVAALREEANR